MALPVQESVGVGFVWRLKALSTAFSTTERKGHDCCFSGFSLWAIPPVNAQQCWFGKDSGSNVTKNCMSGILLKPVRRGEIFFAKCCGLVGQSDLRGMIFHRLLFLLGGGPSSVEGPFEGQGGSDEVYQKRMYRDGDESKDQRIYLKKNWLVLVCYGGKRVVKYKPGNRGSLEAVIFRTV
ncbi:hypothetical protein Ancab_000525 [Ancistrocladus abbreviatus]